MLVNFFQKLVSKPTSLLVSKALICCRIYSWAFFFSVIFLFSNPVFAVEDPNLNLPSKTSDEEIDEFADFNFDIKAPKEVYDPFEKVNRKIFAFNDVADRYILEPVAISYRDYVPEMARKSVRNFFNNLGAPFSVTNSLLQGDGGNAMAGFSSFLINSTLGVFGLFDVAGSKSIKYHEEDFGQTFARYGAGPGPYLMIPFLGPSNVRDFSGLTVKIAINPLSANVFNVGNGDILSDDAVLGMSVVSLVDTRESLIKIIDDIRRNAFDPYAMARSAFEQNRQSKINNKNEI